MALARLPIPTRLFSRTAFLPSPRLRSSCHVTGVLDETRTVGRHFLTPLNLAEPQACPSWVFHFSFIHRATPVVPDFTPLYVPPLFLYSFTIQALAYALGKILNLRLASDLTRLYKAEFAGVFAIVRETYKEMIRNSIPEFSIDSQRCNYLFL